MRRRALVPVLLLAVVACGGDDSGGDDDSSAADDRPCRSEAPDTVPGTTAPPPTETTVSGTTTPTDGTTAPSADTTAPGTTTPSTDTAAPGTTTGEGAEPSGFAGNHPASPDDEEPDDSVVDVELEPMTGESTVPPTTVAPKPEVSVPDEPPTDGIEITDIEDGEGPEARNGDYIELRYVGVSIEDGEEFDSNYDQENPLAVTIGTGQVIPGFDEGLVGLREGGTRQIDIPADLAYGEEEDTPATTLPPGPEGPIAPTTDAAPGTTVGPGTTASAGEGLANPADTTTPPDDDTSTTAADSTETTVATGETTPDQQTDGPPTGPLSFVVEAERLIPRPDVNSMVEPSWCTTELVIDELKEGSGDEVAEEGDTVQAFLVMVRGDNLFQADNDWNQGQPTPLPLEANQDEGVPQGLVDGIEGMKPGGRRILTIPPSLAFGAEGVPPMGLPADKDVVFIVDLVGIS